MRKIKLAAIIGFAVTALLFTQQATFAAKNSDTTRPGWGFGDTNHVHTGPPGHSVNPRPDVNAIRDAVHDLRSALIDNRGNIQQIRQSVAAFWSRIHEILHFG